MSYVPPDLSGLCTPQATVTSCAPQALLFLQLVTRILGGSRDSQQQRQRGSRHSSRSSFDDDFDSFFTSNRQDDASFEEGGDVTQVDFLVIGAGSAGCVVANRLSEMRDWKVLLLEAGDEEPEIAEVPAFAPMLQRSSIDWGYMTQPSRKSCLARPDRRCSWARGRVMGGSSTINYLIYTRGNRLDYDEWASLGNPGWEYPRALEYFKKSEDNGDYDINRNRRYHGVGGYQPVERFPYTDVNNLAIIQAWREMGLDEVDSNAEQQIGTMLLQHTTRNGQRASTNEAFIRPVRDRRKNLMVQPNSFVTRILINPHTKTAFGVEYVQDGKIKRVLASKEVILSAGSLNSPKILMLSGVGPRETLQRFNIPVIKDLRVGFNLQDHTTIDGVVFALTNLTAMSNDMQKKDLDYYLRTQRGPLSATGPLQANSFFQTLLAPDGDPRPDIQVSFDAINVNNFYTDPILTAQTAIIPLAYYDGIMARPILLGPKSRGVVTLNDTDPVYGDPLIFANTFMERFDLDTMVEACQELTKMEQTKAFRKIGAQLVREQLPACTHYPFGTDQYWACVITSYTTTIFHPVGTCKMGPKTDKGAVVDTTLRVYGIKNLRVIDASIMPKIVRGNTNAPVIMIAEKGSDDIKKTWLEHLDYDYQ